MRYGEGSEEKSGVRYNYFENLLDINTSYGEDMYIFTQFEYSVPPILGDSLTGLNTFFMEYVKDDYEVKLGDIYELYGRGLSYFTLQDQNIDYNNAIQGIRLNYYYNNNINFSSLYGRKSYQFRLFPSSRVSDSEIYNNVFLLAINIENDLLGSTQYLFKKQYSVLEYSFIDKIFY